MKSKLGFSVVAAVLLIFGAVPAFAEGYKHMTIVALGDSTTAGTPAFRSPVEAPPDGKGNPQSQYAYWLMQRRPEWRVLNRGVNGERSDQILRRFDHDVTAARPDMVVVLAGVVDIYQGSTAEWVIENLEHIYDKAVAAGIPVAVCTVLPYEGATPNAVIRTKKVNDWIRRTAASRGFIFCDTASAAVDPARPGHLLGSPDGLHPGVDGYRHMGEAIAMALEKSIS